MDSQGRFRRYNPPEGGDESPWKEVLATPAPAQDAEESGDAKVGVTYEIKEEYLGEELHVPKWAGEGAAKAVNLAMSDWDAALQELMAHLDMPDLAATVVKAYKEEEDARWAETSKVSAKEMHWHKQDGWFVPPKVGPVLEAFGQAVPAAKAALLVDGKASASMEGDGVLLAALDAASLKLLRSDTLLAGDASEVEAVESAAKGIAALESGVILMVAMVDRKQGAGLERIMKALSAVDIGWPLGALPAGCTVATAVGRKGLEGSWQHTQASNDVALASCSREVLLWSRAS
eukprot:TRINITY_DN22842_c0_g1_i2.p1 TRINITY_DN22842_c0_g1~~TRINITY_DN22842_c0_g1_i2.p1  ORF type:complete len:290 (-),score=78.25 TRINITY_DN22842_c0_g1_i2:93-962(-)